MRQCQTLVKYKALLLFRTHTSLELVSDNLQFAMETVHSHWQTNFSGFLGYLYCCCCPRQSIAKSYSISPSPVSWLVWGTGPFLWFLFSLTQEVLKNRDFCPLCIGIFEAGLWLFLKHIQHCDRQCIQLSSSDPPRHRALNQKLAQAF